LTPTHPQTCFGMKTSHFLPCGIFHNVTWLEWNRNVFQRQCALVNDIAFWKNELQLAFLSHIPPCNYHDMSLWCHVDKMQQCRTCGRNVTLCIYAYDNFHAQFALYGCKMYLMTLHLIQPHGAIYVWHDGGK
jgi:hypothetical protein